MEPGLASARAAFLSGQHIAAVRTVRDDPMGQFGRGDDSLALTVQPSGVATKPIGTVGTRNKG